MKAIHLNYCVYIIIIICLFTISSSIVIFIIFIDTELAVLFLNLKCSSFNFSIFFAAL